MNEFEKKAIALALRNMFKGHSFDICTINSCLKIAKLPKNGDYDALHALHCVDYKEMSDDIKREVFKRTLGMFNQKQIFNMEMFDAVLNEKPLINNGQDVAQIEQSDIDPKAKPEKVDEPEKPRKWLGLFGG